MFKKALEAKSHRRLSGADKKKLRRSAKERFTNASDDDIDTILPSKAEITLAKYPNRAYVYSIEGEFPMLIDADGRGTEIFPTVYALWKVPDLLPAFILKGGGVSRYIIGGADLMFPGISLPSEGLPSFVAGHPWAVKVPGNPAPIAVGTTAMSSEEALKAGLRGKALRIIHYYGDSLWASVEGRFVPNAGFFEDVVIEDAALSSASLTPDPSEGSSDNLHGVVTLEKGEPADDGGVSDHLHDLKVSDDVPAEEQNVGEKEQQTLSIEEMDGLLDKCLLQALHTTVKDKDMPMPGSTLWSGHVLLCRPPGVTLDIKKSSHKKLSKWLQAKSSAGLISSKEDKHKKETVLLSVNRTHPEYTSFEPEKRSPEGTDRRHDAAPVAEGRQPGPQALEVAEIYRPSAHVGPVFASVGADARGFYSASEAADVVFRYVEKESLVKPTDRAVVVLDAALCDALYKGAVKKGSSYPTEIHKKDLGAAFLSRMQAHHRASRGDDVVVAKGAVRPIQIMTERRQGSKKVTRVSGVETFLLDADSLASELQRKFACSTSVAELPGKKGQHEVLVQGGVIDNLAKHFVDHYGIPKRYIEVLDKTKR